MPAKDRVEFEPLGDRILIAREESKRTTKAGIALPDQCKIPTLTGVVVKVSQKLEANKLDCPIEELDRVIYDPRDAIPVEFDVGNKLFIVPIESILAVRRG